MKKSRISKIVVCLMLFFLPSQSAHAFGSLAEFIQWLLEQINSTEYGVVVYAEATAHGKVYVDGDQFTDKAIGGVESVNSQTSNSANDPQTFKLNAISATGYEFAGWDESNPATVPYESTQNPYNFVANTSSTPGSGGIVTYRRYAFFNPVQYTISYLIGDHGTGSMSQSIYTIESVPSISQCTFTAESGYAFNKWQVTSNTAGGWTKNELLSGGQTLSVGRYGDVTLTAQWTPITYTIKFAAGEHGSGSMSDATYNIAGTAGITAVPTSSFTAANGYEFSGWKITSTSVGSWTQNDPVSAGTALTGKYGDVTLTAQWTPIEYTISFSGNGGTGTGPAQKNYTIESTGITLPANTYTKSGYIFSGWQPTANVGNWTTSESYAAGSTVSAGKYGNVTLTAQWKPKADITITVSGLDDNESAIFTVSNGGGVLYTVALSGSNPSVIIKDLPTDVQYTVQATNGWSWAYGTPSPTSHNFNLGTAGYTAGFTYTKNTSAKKHAEKSNVNWKN